MSTENGSAVWQAALPGLQETLKAASRGLINKGVGIEESRDDVAGKEIDVIAAHILAD